MKPYAGITMQLKPNLTNGTNMKVTSSKESIPVEYAKLQTRVEKMLDKMPTDVYWEMRKQFMSRSDPVIEFQSERLILEEAGNRHIFNLTSTMHDAAEELDELTPEQVRNYTPQDNLARLAYVLGKAYVAAQRYRDILINTKINR